VLENAFQASLQHPSQKWLELAILYFTFDNVKLRNKKRLNQLTISLVKTSINKATKA